MCSEEDSNWIRIIIMSVVLFLNIIKVFSVIQMKRPMNTWTQSQYSPIFWIHTNTYSSFDDFARGCFWYSLFPNRHHSSESHAFFLMPLFWIHYLWFLWICLAHRTVHLNVWMSGCVRNIRDYSIFTYIFLHNIDCRIFLKMKWNEIQIDREWY